MGFAAVKPQDIAGDPRSEGAKVRSEICRLLLKYGNWGCAVVTQSGEVVSSPQYLLACKMTKMAARVYYIADDQVATAGGFFRRTYGRFSYEHLKRTTWIQTLAQPFRLRCGKEDQEGKESSRLYRLAIPYFKKDMRILDFGCGQGDYVREMSRKGFNIRGIEFFRRKGKDLDRMAVRRMCDDVIRDVAKNGLYDIVLADSVVNSVDTLQAEADVVITINAFAKRNALVFFSGRSRESVEEGSKVTIYSRPRDRGVEPLDENGFSGMYREGTWFFQKFINKSQAIALGEKYLGVGEYKRMSPISWQYFAPKTVIHSQEVYEASLMREFDLPWPEGDCVNRGKEMVSAWRAASKDLTV